MFVGENSRRKILYEEFHPWGTSAYRSGDSGYDVSPRRYRYTGKERDEESGLDYHGLRYRVPWLGRWSTADPLGMVDGPNLYAYARDNPVRLSDPSGGEGMPHEVERAPRIYSSGFRPGEGAPRSPASANPVRANVARTSDPVRQGTTTVTSGSSEKLKANAAAAVEGAASYLSERAELAAQFAAPGVVATTGVVEGVYDAVTGAQPQQTPSLADAGVTTAHALPGGSVAVAGGGLAAAVEGGDTAQIGSAIAQLQVAAALLLLGGAFGGKGGGGGPPPPRPPSSSLPADKVLRAINPDEVVSIRAGLGIVKPDPPARTTPTQHVGGTRHSRDPWVSTTRSPESAEFFATHGGTRPANPIIEIDLTKVPGRIIDVSTPSNASRHLATRFSQKAAARHQEVLIEGSIPPEAIRLLEGGPSR